MSKYFVKTCVKKDKRTIYTPFKTKGRAIADAKGTRKFSKGYFSTVKVMKTTPNALKKKGYKRNRFGFYTKSKY